MFGQRTKRATSVSIERIAFLLSVCALTLIGLVMVYSASMPNQIDNGASPYSRLITQGAFVVLGIIAAIVVWRLVPYHAMMGKLLFLYWVGCVALIVVAAVAGNEEYGAQRWISIGGVVTIQPSEFLKIALIMVTVYLMYCYQNQLKEVKTILIMAFCGVAAPLAFMFVTQSDLGTTMICCVGIVAVLWFGGVSWQIIAGIIAVGILFGLYAIFGTSYRSDRMVFLNPFDDGENGYGAGYNIIRAKTAVVGGGLFGAGLGNSHEKYQYLFASDSDFIFAVLVEELGLLGSAVVMGLFLILLWSGLRIASNAPDALGTMIAGSLTVMLVFQAFLNMGCAIGVLPTTGKPLPFISSGGSSALASFLMVGIVMAVSEGSRESAVYEQRRANLRIVRVNSREEKRPYRSGRGLAATFMDDTSESTDSRRMATERSSRAVRTTHTGRQAATSRGRTRDVHSTRAATPARATTTHAFHSSRRMGDTYFNDRAPLVMPGSRR